MKLFKVCLIAFFITLAVMPLTNALAQALPVAQPDNVNRAVSGAVQEAMKRRGFAANDPRFLNTLARMSPKLSLLAVGAATVTVGAVTAPAWASFALAVGIGTVVTYAVSLGIDSLVEWYFRDDGNIDLLTDGQSGLDTSNGVQAGMPAWKGYVSTISQSIWGGDGIAVASQVSAMERKNLGLPERFESCKLIAEGKTWSCGAWGKAHLYADGPEHSCGQGTYLSNGSCLAYEFPTETSISNTTDLTVEEAIALIPDSDLDTQLNPVIIAGLANKAWEQAASQPDYDGLPYPQSNPITKADVEPWLQAHPEYVPTVRDFVAPNPVDSSVPHPWGIPANPAAPGVTPANPNSGTTNPAQESSQVNLGPDPAIGAPSLENIPTAQQIANPILQLAPDLRSFQVNGYAGVCPRPTVELYGTHVMDAHCKLIEDNKQVLQLAMAFAWAAMALFIVLSA
ncbi:hypothetical protein [Comamonas sp. NoAH]|uniref:hypothetical protein n=1 Tax=Comamonas halotolerans TaxID=3041496 RepID=UPI0024E083A8|nr:hypothetical protein [Comamonas sp. NoAH]